MSLTTGRGPLSGNPAGRFSDRMPDGIVYVEPFRRRVRGVAGGRTVVDSERVLLVHRPGEAPSYAFPADDVDLAADADTDPRSGSAPEPEPLAEAPDAGTDVDGRLSGERRPVAGARSGSGTRVSADAIAGARFSSGARLGPRTGSGARSAAPEPLSEVPGYVQVAWDAVDAWYEEDEEVIYHPRNPYHRVDCVRTSRRLRVEVGGVVLVDTTDTLGVYETALEPRLYVRPDAVRRDLLVAGSERTYCPYKGTAWYWTAVVGDLVVENVAWSYEDPLPESLPLRGMLSFDEARASVIHDLPPVTDLTTRPSPGPDLGPR